MADAIDEFLGKTGVATASSPEQQNSAIDDFLSGSPAAAPDYRPAIRAGLEKGPDAAAKTQRTARELGLPEVAIESDPQAMQWAADEKAIDSFLAEAPVTRDFVAVPENGAVAADRDTVQEMGFFEGLVNTFSKEFESVPAGFDAGRVQSREGMFTLDAMLRLSGEELKNAMAASGERMQAAGEPETFLGSAANVIGQNFGTIEQSPERFATLLGGGALTGAATGAMIAGAPGAIAGAARGLGAGAASFFVVSAFQQEAANTFQGMIQAGVDPEDAKLLAIGAGVINAALETGSAAVLLKPFTSAVKGMMKEGAKKALMQEGVLKALRDFGVAYGKGVAAEVSTEVAQELIQVTAEEIGKAFSPEELQGATVEQITERVAQIAEKTFKAMVVLGPVGPGSSFVVQMHNKVKQTQTDADALKKMNGSLTGSKLMQRAPEKAVEHAEAVIKSAKVKDIYIPAAVLTDFAEAIGTDPASLYKQLGVEDQIGGALVLGSDVKLTPRAFVEHILASEKFDQIADHIRHGVDGLTPAEAEEFKQSGVQDEIDRVSAPVEEDQGSRNPAAEEALTSDSVQAREGALDVITNDAERQAMPGRVKTVDTPEQLEVKRDLALREAGFSPEEIAGMTPADKAELTAGEVAPTVTKAAAQAVDVAANELGLQGLFRSANEAGLAPAEYQSYLLAVQQAADASRIRQEEKLLRQRMRAMTKAWKAELEIAKETARESLSQEKTYAAVQSIGRERLNRAQVIAALPDGEKQLGMLPQQDRGRSIFTDKNEAGGLDLDTFAQLHEFYDGQTMLFAMMDAVPFEQRVAEVADHEMRTRHGDLLEEKQAIEAARESLHNDQTANVLAFEMNQLRKAQGQGALRPALLRKAAKEGIRSHKIGDIDPKKFIAASQRLGRQAGKMLRKGNRAGAAQAKFQQLLNFQYAQEAYAARAKVEKQRKYLQKFNRHRSKWTALPGDYLDVIRAMLQDYGLDPRLSNKKRKDLQAWMEQKQAAGESFEIPQRLLDATNKKHYRDMTLADWQELYETVREAHHRGVNERKMLLESEKRERDAIAAEVKQNIFDNLKQRVRALESHLQWEKIKRFGPDVLAVFMNPDTVVLEMDGFKYLGAAYHAIKRPIDRAISEGYHKGQIGYQAQKKKQAQALNRIYAAYPVARKKQLYATAAIPGFNRHLTKAGQLSVILNMGTEDNLAALLDSKQFTQEELNAILAAATKDDMDFVNAVWDHLRTFWPDIEAAMIRRQGFAPEQVEARPLETPHGRSPGGYYPLRYDPLSGVGRYTPQQEREDIVKKARFGGFARSQTRRGHTKERVGSGGRGVKLDLSVLHAHIDQVIYDLEVGDAVTDAYRILHHHEVQGAFRDTGHMEKWNSLSLWMENVAIGELRLGGPIEDSFRWLRTGYTVSKLAWNVSTAALQLLGLSQTAATIGTGNMLRGVLAVARSPQGGPNSVYQFVASQSGLMAQREETFSRDIADAQRQLSQSILVKWTPGKSAEYVQASFFYGIKKMQRIVDTMTWLGARYQGLKMFNNDITKAIEYADRAVVRSQGSGNFHERTMMERGTINVHIQQSEVVRAFTTLISYFTAKANIAYEKTRTTNFRNPGDIARWAVDMTLLFIVDGAITALIRQGVPDDDDDDGIFDDLGWFLAKVGLSSATSGIPIVRDIVAEAQGMRGGGVISSAVDVAGKFFTQAEQGEVDAALRRSSVNLFGMILKAPASQINKTLDALDKAANGEETSWEEYIFGPAFDN